RLSARAGLRTVLNLAAGLDARPYRLPLPRDLRWLHVDLPEMIDYVRERLAGEAPVCSLDYLAADLTSAAGRDVVVDRAGAAGGPALAVSEGLLTYLPPERVSYLARDLARLPAIRWWLFDIASPRLLEMLNKRWQPILAAGNSPMIFAPAEG